MGEDAKDEVCFTSDQAISSIQAWKAHLLRSLNQDQARLDIDEHPGIDDLQSWSKHLGHFVFQVRKMYGYSS